MKNSIPNFGNGNASGKFHSRLLRTEIPFPFSGTGIQMENSIPNFGNGNASGKFHSHFREREFEWQIPFPTFGTGIGGRYSREWPGTGIPAHPCFIPLLEVSVVFNTTNNSISSINIRLLNSSHRYCRRAFQSHLGSIREDLYLCIPSFLHLALTLIVQSTSHTCHI